jgi:hypothetical protein
MTFCTRTRRATVIATSALLALALALAPSGCSSSESHAAAADASALDGSGNDAGMFCSAPPPDLASCTTVSDCAVVGLGCGCGMQLEYGVATKYLGAQTDCEQAAAAHCTLGCPGQLGHLAQDGRSDVDGGAIAVRCVAGDGGTSTCQTYVP